MDSTKEITGTSSPNMESINRVAKLPVVESTVNAASGLYSRVKDSNSYINSFLNTAESTFQSAVLATQPITNKLEGPIKSMDSMLCTGLDYVEEKVPGVKLPPQQMYENTKNLVCSKVQPAVKCVCENVQRVKGVLTSPCEAGEQCLHRKQEETPDVTQPEKKSESAQPKKA